MSKRNRAKCKLCNSIVESFLQYDYVTCKCGEISVSGGAAMYCSARDFNNFLRIDEDDKEINVRYQEKEIENGSEEQGGSGSAGHKPSRDELLSMLQEMIKSYENLPQQALLAPVTHADQLSLLMLVLSLFKAS